MNAPDFLTPAILLRLSGLSLTLLLGGCSTPRTAPAMAADPVVSARLPADQINWPAAYAPAEATFFVHNEIEIQAPPAVVWEILIQANQWPDWYVGATHVSVIGAADGRLAAGSRLAWNTMGLRFESEIKEFAPPFRLSWESRKTAIRGYHAWLIIATPQGCRVITDESQHGFLAVMQGIFIPKKLHRLHDIWLAELKKRAEARVAQAAPPDQRLP